VHFNVDEILQIAEKIEINGHRFYLAAAKALPDHRDWFNHLAQEEASHQNIFDDFHQSFASEGETYQSDPEDLASRYLQSIADSMIFALDEEPEAFFTGSETVDDVFKDAVRREQEAILYYTGLKNAMTDEKSKEQIELIIQEEMTHITWLKKKQYEIEHQGDKTKAEKIYDLLIIGAGPGGISMAAEVVEAGFDKDNIMILEGSGKSSWMIRRLYPEQKLVTANYKGASPETVGVLKMHDMTKQYTLDMLSNVVKQYNLPVIHNQTVHTVEKKDGLFHIESNDLLFKAKHCVIAIGVFGKPNKPDYKIPRKVLALTHYDITSTKIENSKVMVVGGGDSSADYVNFLLKAGNKITLSSRNKALSSMTDENRRTMQTLGLSSKIELLAGSVIKEVKEDAQGIRVIFENEELSSVVVDRIVYALGGTTPLNFLQIAGIDVEDSKPILSEHNETNIPGLYLTGDLAAKGAGAIATAFNSSHYAANDFMEKYYPELVKD